MLAAAPCATMLVNWAVAPGKRVVVVTNNDDAYRTAIALHEAGVEVPRGDLDARPAADRARCPISARARASG
jgi:sarcosine oxidase, subunit alpha